MRFSPFLISLLFLLCIPATLAFGVSPAIIDLGDVNPGGYAESSVLLSSVTKEEWLVQLEGAGLNGDWLAGDPPSALISFGNPIRATIALEVPADAAPGLYTTQLQITFGMPQIDRGEKRSRIMQLLSVPVSYTVVSDASAECLVGGVMFGAVEQGQQAAIRYSIKNTGTVRTRPIFTFQILDTFGERLSDSWTSDEILPTRSEEMSHVFRMSLPAGEYELLLSSPSCNYEERFPYVIAEVGSLSRSGTFTELKVGEVTEGPMPVTAVFSNTGGAPVEARLSGVVVDEQGVVIAVFEGESLLVMPGNTVTFEELVEVLPGDYTVRAKVLYEGEVSDEREIHVMTGTIAESRSLNFVVIIFFGVVIIILVVLISEKKGGKTHKRKVYGQKARRK